MSNIEEIRKNLDRFIVEKEFNLSDSEVIKKALETEKLIKNSQA